MKRAAIVLVSFGVVAVLLCACLYRGLAGAGTTWKSTSVRDDNFLVLLFPVAQNTSCQRAVLANLAEYHREFLEVYLDGAAVTVPRSDFTPVPPQDCNVYVERLNRELDAWGAETDWSRIQYAMTPAGEGGKVTVTVTDKRGTIRAYAYLIQGTSVHPVEVTTDVNIARNMAQ
jgi:hypothetical protein